MDLVELKKQNITARHPWETVRIRVVADKIATILKDELEAGQEINVLDVGSGDAYVIDQLVDIFPQLNFHGVDIFYDDELMKKIHGQLKNKNDIKLFSDWKNPELVSTKIDLILFLDVLEHIEDDVAVLQNINTLLPNSFKFIITVPAFNFLFASHDKFLVHYRRYNNALLKKHVHQAGWQDISTGYFFAVLVLPRLLVKLKEKIIKPQEEAKGISTWNQPSWITKLVEGVFWADYKVCKALQKVGIKLPGLSNYMIGKRTV